MVNKKRVLIVEDDRSLARLMQTYLNSHGFEVMLEVQGDQGLSCIIKERPDLVILDMMLPNMNGLDVCRASRQHYDGLILMLTASDHDDALKN